MKVKSKPLYDLFYITICHKVPLAWCQKNTPSNIFNYENENCYNSSDPSFVEAPPIIPKIIILVKKPFKFFHEKYHLLKQPYSNQKFNQFLNVKNE